ncbi:MAG: GtrA family protein [Betaproteobacteria bacterium]|nr:GtrA family protein [Betaproteobacteria bacterium]
MKQGIWFLIVGAVASAVHIFAFWLLNEYWLPGIWPEINNTLAFAVAFVFSFLGHRLLSFPDANVSVWVSLMRFGLSALAGFLTNQAVFMALTRWIGWWPTLALIVALVLAAAQTYLLGRYWAFRRHLAPPG